MISNSLKMMVDANTAPVINSLSVTKNGTYTAPDGVDGYSPITVDVQEEPWQPLEDGYSNFWFELTNDTLSPWLVFETITNNATIDWGDGTGEQSLTILTPTHTYSKAGKYIVKCKGVTRLTKQYDAPYNDYIKVLKYVECNNEITALSAYTFQNAVGLRKAVFPYVTIINNTCFSGCSALEEISIPRVTTFSAYMLRYCFSLSTVTMPTTVTSIGAFALGYCISLSSIIIPQNVTEMGNSVFSTCNSLSEIHVQATIPPTLGTTPFSGLPNDYIIYVPVGTAETYKAASGWSTYADHILEEGQQRGRAMLSKSEDTLTDEPNTPEER